MPHKISVDGKFLKQAPSGEISLDVEELIQVLATSQTLIDAFSSKKCVEPEAKPQAKALKVKPAAGASGVKP